MSTYNVDCFKAYDIRGRVPSELNNEIAYLIGNAFAAHLDAKRVVIGFDIRITSPEIAAEVARGVTDTGCSVIDIGMCGTEEVYHAVFSDQDCDGGIMVTASHNPADYNGMKLVRKGSRPVGADSGLKDIKERVAAGKVVEVENKGQISKQGVRQSYLKHLLGYISPESLASLKIVVNAGHGGAGLVIDELERYLPLEFIKIYNEPDGTFPQGVPNPLLEENRDSTAQAVVEHGADFGVAWDGDFDRCFFFDETGAFVEGYYIVGLLAEAFLSKPENSGAKIVHDPRLTWNTIETVEKLGGVAVESKTGHAFIKEKMREVDAVYGGEMSAHHYFREFAYCDSGMIPWLLIAELVARKKEKLSDLVASSQKRYPVSGEINSIVEDPKALIKLVEEKYSLQAKSVSYVDGLSMGFDDWRFNLRMSNTEPVIRLNVESDTSHSLMKARRDELLRMLG